MADRSGLNQGLDFLLATAGAIASYNLAGILFNEVDSDRQVQFYLTTGILTAGTILGYKARRFMKKAKRKLKRMGARVKFLSELNKVDSDDFLYRQGIQTGEFGSVRKGLKYLLTVPLGGALGYIPGMIGITPLCVHFGGYYHWSEDASLGSGPYTGMLIGAYAFGEMTAKKQYERLVTTASALAGASASLFLVRHFDLSMLESYRDLYSGLAIASGNAVIFGELGNIIYRKIDRSRKGQ